MLIVASGDAACEIMKTNYTIFSNRPKLAISDRLLYEGKDVSTAPYGEHWRRMRSICVLQPVTKGFSLLEVLEKKSWACWLRL